ncbi:Oxidoreductase UcpA [Cercospora beticola]|uniref:Oxidoreductase UcpA n=1 Tax=Cercospora beticola TaxID=122368 RepID=A0A2G5I0S8_CERBT|nr:Oxidoreductase UcpA [Cercospora beticola]PIA98361.1 Oxidoreductase UcpA [Cercospora beticola]WPA98917.1 hypothetical protein RHO25_003530 [Cercospora beticola]CAK1360212.1 unnamed protein product [Cercospora beticola]
MVNQHPLSAAALLSVKGWVVLVIKAKSSLTKLMATRTGGGTGIGLMLTQAFATNGAKVYITGRRTEVLETTAKVHGSAEKLGEQGGSIVPLQMDTTDKKSISAAVELITKNEGYLNVLVNNAGVWTTKPSVEPDAGPEQFGKAMFDENPDDWQRAFLTNATSLYFVTAAFLPLLAKSADSPIRRGGSVINNTSNSGLLRMSEGGQLAYNVSKAAAVHVTRQMAYDLSHKAINVRVNQIAPGWFPTEMTTGGSDAANMSAPQEDGEFQKEMETIGARVPPGRMGNAQDLASAVLTLATNDYMWGTITVVDGGITQSMPGNM